MAQNGENWKKNLEFSAQTNLGMRRSNNQDSHAVVLASDRESWIERGHVFLVADGMGAHAAGELASKLAADNVPHTYFKLRDLPPPAALEKSVLDANTLIHGRGQADSDFHGMGTTCSALVLLPEGALASHVGDSRVYRLRQGAFEQLTFDHSLVWEMIETGRVKSEDAIGFVPKNVITRSLGPNAQVKVDLEGPHPIEVGDTYLMCSDGLTGPVHDDEIAAILSALPVEEAVTTLIDLANLRGGPDNITVIAVRVNGPLFDPSEGGAKREKAGAVHPAIGVSLAALLMLSVGMLVLGEWIGAALTVGGMLLLGIIGLVQHGNRQSLGRNAIGVRFGKGPYRRYPGAADAAMVERFAETVNRLSQAATRDHLALDRPRFDGFAQAAQRATADGKFNEAMAQYCHTIRFVTGELQKVRHR